MAKKEFYYRWEWVLKSSPEQLWPLIADTNRFDHDTGLPSYDEPEKSSTMGLTNTRRRLRIRMLGVPLDYVEEPFEWIRPYRFGVIRNYQAGLVTLLSPLKQLRVQAQLTEMAEGGTRLLYEVWVQPRTFLGTLTIPIQIGKVYARRFEETFRAYDAMTEKPQQILSAIHPQNTLSTAAERRLATMQQTLAANIDQPELIDKLIELIRYGDELTLIRLRPYLLAGYWKANRRDVLELMLMATRVGLLDFQWDLLCPMCRVAKESVERLADVGQHVHCDTCNIDYTANFDQSVELTFRPNSAVRTIPKQVAFCTSGPEAMPHVSLQQLLAAGRSRLVMPELEPGRYRLRTADLPGAQHFQVREGGEAETAVFAITSGWPSTEIDLSPTPLINLENQTDNEQLFIMERVAWTDNAATAAEVTTLQRFRDLFSEEALRPGDQISVGSLTILFTDLVDSTRMYREIGDATAFGLVMNHFDVLREAIREEDGAIVKTIGDAVMAVFRSPISAVRAVHTAQQRLANMSGIRPLHLKAAIHYGPSIAVTLNKQLDYFGSTINIASRLEKFSQGSDIILSDAVYSDPEVADYLSGDDAPSCFELIESTLKGFDEECFTMWRVDVGPQIESILDSDSF
jgi:class 3 adenylate cyclase